MEKKIGWWNGTQNWTLRDVEILCYSVNIWDPTIEIVRSWGVVTLEQDFEKACRKWGCGEMEKKIGWWNWILTSSFLVLFVVWCSVVLSFTGLCCLFVFSCFSFCCFLMSFDVFCCLCCFVAFWCSVVFPRDVFFLVFGICFLLFSSFLYLSSIFFYFFLVFSIFFVGFVLFFWIG